MADVYFDLDRTSGTQNGNAWSTAYYSLSNMETAIAGASAGDRLFFKGQASLSGNFEFYFSNSSSTHDNPILVFGCNSATTNEPPVSSDLISDSEDSDIPELITSGTIRFRGGGAKIYGMEIGHSNTSGQMYFTESLYYSSILEFYDCHFPVGTLLRFTQATGMPMNEVLFERCSFARNNTSAGVLFSFYSGCIVMNDCKYNGTGSHISQFISYSTSTSYGNHRHLVVDGFDASPITSTFCYAFGHTDPVILKNVRMGTGGSLFAEIWNGKGVLTGCVAGSYANAVDESLKLHQVISHRGEVDTETTAVRTGGFTDIDGNGLSLALTPNVNATVEQILSVSTEPIIVEVTDTGSQTFTIELASSDGGTYDDTEVWAEFWYPTFDSQRRGYATTMADQMASGTNLTTSSETWGTGASGPKKISQALTIGYPGFVEVVVHFAKRYASSPATIYVCPKIEVT